MTKSKKMAMRASRKGTKLNDVYYFHQPSSHPRNKMTLIKVFPETLLLPDNNNNLARDKCSLRRKNHERLLASQASKELATYLYEESDSVYSVLSTEISTSFKNRETQTEVRFILPVEQEANKAGKVVDDYSRMPDFLTENKLPSIITRVLDSQQSEEIANFLYSENDSDYSVLSIEMNDLKRESLSNKFFPGLKQQDPSRKRKYSRVREISPINEIPSLIAIFPPTGFHSTEVYSGRKVSPEVEVSSRLKVPFGVDCKPLVVTEEKNFNTCVEENDSSKNSWWRNNILRQVFVNFFLQFRGRTDTQKSKKSRKNLLKEYNSVATSTKNKLSRSRRKKLVDERQCLWNEYMNSYDVPLKRSHRNRSNKISRQDRVILNLMRVTGEKNLRAIIIEQELKARVLEEENAHFKKIFDKKLKTRQRSSPFH